jgi:hypothetical protein
MILGLSVETFTVLHVVISLIAIVAGTVVVAGLLSARPSAGWTALFLLATLLTSLTGFLFPITSFTPALGTGIVASLVLAAALWALYGKKLDGAWRWIYVVAAVASLYLNVFVLIVQAFQKLAVLQALAPTQSEPPFLIAQAAALIVFVLVGAAAVIRFRPDRPLAV